MRNIYIKAMKVTVNASFQIAAPVYGHGTGFRSPKPTKAEVFIKTNVLLGALRLAPPKRVQET